MKQQVTLLLAVCVAFAINDASAQSNDAAAERARIANQRIAAEAARRAPVDVDESSATGAAAVADEMPEIAEAAPAPVAAIRSADSSTDNSAVPAAASAPAPPRPDNLPDLPSEPAPVMSAAPAETMERVPAEEAPARSAEPPLDASPAGATGSVGGALDELEKLGRLRDAGYVTDAEFDRIKQRILDANF